MSFDVLNYAKAKLLSGDFNMASSYYARAIDNGIEPCVVNLRYLTKEYLVYPLEYEDSSRYFELIKELHKIAQENTDYLEEYKLAVTSLADIKRLFLRSLSLFYYSDILVTPSDSVVLRQVAEIQRYIKVNKEELLNDDVYQFSKYVPKYNKKLFAKDLNTIEAYCMNILLSYTAEQHSVYLGKSINAYTVDYGYFYGTTVKESDRYYNYANVKPRLFLLGYEAYYHDIHAVYKAKLKEIGHGFDCPKTLKKELTEYVEHKDKKDASAKDFIKYAKQFEKKDSSRQSFIGLLMKINKFNPFLKIIPIDRLFKDNVGSFELNEFFPQKKLWGVCSMLAAGKGWKVNTVRYFMILFGCLFIGVFVYLALAIAKQFGFYFGVNVEKP